MRRLPFLLATLLLPLALGPGGARPGIVVQSTWVMTELDARGEPSAAYAVNQRGDVVGTSQDPAGAAVSGSRVDPRVVVWRRDGKMIVIGRTHIDLWPGLLLNDRGQVAWKEPGVGWMLWKDGKERKLGWIGARAMNARGQIVGSSLRDGRFHAVLWENGRVRDLGLLPGHVFSEATSINDSGAVVGTSLRAAPGSATRAVLWRAKTMRDLGVLPGFNPSSSECVALQINRRGQVLGSCTQGERQRAFLWGTGMRDLRVGARAIYPDALNDRAQVVGTDRVGGYLHPFLWVNGKLTDLGALGGELTNAWPTAINNRGQVIGVSGPAPAGRGHAFVWEDGVMTDLAPTAAASQALDISDEGQIVGWISTGGGRTRAVAWTRHGE